jgi:ectoine hydroxylase-related dioxygenase (phytanoyl-CoA dioxygenase family)
MTWQPGDMFIFNPFVWHRERPSPLGKPTIAAFHQFTRPFIKPHADYCRSIPANVFAALPPRTRRLLGWDSRVPTSMQDFYLPEEERPFRAGQW